MPPAGDADAMYLLLALTSVGDGIFAQAAKTAGAALSAASEDTRHSKRFRRRSKMQCAGQSDATEELSAPSHRALETRLKKDQEMVSSGEE